MTSDDVLKMTLKLRMTRRGLPQETLETLGHQRHNQTIRTLPVTSGVGVGRCMYVNTYIHIIQYNITCSVSTRWHLKQQLIYRPAIPVHWPSTLTESKTITAHIIMSRPYVALTNEQTNAVNKKHFILSSRVIYRILH